MNKSLILMAIAALLSGCASTKRPVLPSDHTTLGNIQGLEDTRFWGDEDLPNAEAYTAEVRKQIMASNPEVLNQPQNFLAISGGGQNGAFGAGVLNGWSQKGDRPSFRSVTGISTGAILAPFAFLGADYDHVMRELYSAYSTKQVLNKSILSALFGGDSLADSEPLFKLIEHYLDDEAVERIATEYNKGRRLYVGTTNMDALRPVIWDLGAIAASNHPDKANYLHRIILASAAVPGAFPPEIFEVSKGEVNYNEVHVDGGIGNQIFITPASVSIRQTMEQVGFTQSGTIYVIRNNPTKTDWQLIKPSAIALSMASIGGLTRNQGNANQYIIFLQARIDGMKCRSAQIPASFKVESSEAFDTDYMQQLYDIAYDMALKGYPWTTKPERFSH